jgi:hypothetical protein
MVARLLHECGLALGPQTDLGFSNRHNPGGHYENLSFVKLNEEIINQLGGSWSNPPNFPAGWAFTSEANAFVERGEKLLDRFGHENWGWKDPRSSLTIDFWQRLIPDLRVVICLRSPIDVTRSLFVRGDLQTPSQFQLWLTYYRHLVSTTRAANRLVTHYQSYFHNPQAELRRVLTWLDLDVSDEEIEQACPHVSADWRHHQSLTSDLTGEVSNEVLSLYFGLCAEAGPVYEEARKLEVASQLKDERNGANEVVALMSELERLRPAYKELASIHHEIVNSKSFKLVSLIWGLRRRQ